MTKPHSRVWYAQLAAETGAYEYPWTQVLTAPSGEVLFDTLLEELLTPECDVLEAGCGHGLDAQKYAQRVRSYTGYDFTLAFLERAKQNAPQAEFVLWDSSCEPTPEAFKGRFDLVVSRRGPTSVILHLRQLCSPGAHVLCLHPDDGVNEGATEERIGERLAQVGLTPDAEWHTCIKGFLPTLEDFILYRRFHGDARAPEALCAEWDEGADKGKGGFLMEERRYMYLVRMPELE